MQLLLLLLLLLVVFLVVFAVIVTVISLVSLQKKQQEGTVIFKHCLEHVIKEGFEDACLHFGGIIIALRHAAIDIILREKKMKQNDEGGGKEENIYKRKYIQKKI